MLQTDLARVDVCQDEAFPRYWMTEEMKPELLQSLNREAGYGHPVHEIQWRETHISWVILTGDYVYKLKKPVDFGFLDFSSIEKRRYYCEEEVRLNQRTASDLYLEVVPLCVSHGQANFKGEGQVVDYAVKMKQFNPDATLLQVLQQQEPGGDLMQQIGYSLAEFHSLAQVAGEGKSFGSNDAVAYPVEENFRQILPLLKIETDRSNVEKLKAWSLNQLSELEPIFQHRKNQGYIRECHGDLHLGNVAVLDHKAVMFDCIEFNENFRWIDCASDLAFLIMDMQYNGYPDYANSVLNSYLEYSFDYGALKVLKFYMAYRAMVRAKVLLLRLNQAEIESQEQETILKNFRGYVEYCLGLVDSGSIFMVLTQGVSGSGKSTFARQLCARSSAIHLRSDVVRKHLAGLKPLQKSDSQLTSGIYSADFSNKTFTCLLQLASDVLSCGYPVVVDATFLAPDDRAPFLALGKKLPVHTLICSLNAPKSVLLERIKQRNRKNNDSSEATQEVLEKQVAREHIIWDEEREGFVFLCNDQGDWTLKPVLERLGLDS